MRSMVEGACSIQVDVAADAPSTAPTRGPLPRFAGQDDKFTPAAGHIPAPH